MNRFLVCGFWQGRVLPEHSGWCWGVIVWVPFPTHAFFSEPLVGWEHWGKAAWGAPVIRGPLTLCPTPGLQIQQRTRESAFLQVLRWCFWDHTWNGRLPSDLVLCEVCGVAAQNLHWSPWGLSESVFCLPPKVAVLAVHPQSSPVMSRLWV